MLFSWLLAAVLLAGTGAAAEAPPSGEPAAAADGAAAFSARVRPVTNSRENEMPRNREARLLRTVPPEYPVEFRGTGVTAPVVVELMVDRLGRASHVRVVSSPDLAFTEAALDALAKWEFLPAIQETKLTNRAFGRLSVLVTEDFGDNPFFDYEGGRIALMDIGYAGEHDEPVRRLRGWRAPYPFDQLAAGQAGEVVLEFDIGESGTPSRITVLEATSEPFSLAAQGAVAHWVFSPASKSFRVVPARLRYRISFQPEEYSETVRQMARDILAGRPTGLATTTEIDEKPLVMRYLQPVCPPDFGVEVGRQRVTIGLIVTGEGRVLLPRIVSATDPKAGYLALAALNHWHFRPAQKQRLPVPVSMTVPVVF